MVIGVEDNILSAPIVISLVTLEIIVISYMDGLLTLPTLLSHLILCYLDLTPLRAPHLRVSPLLVVIMMPISDIRQPHQLLLPRPIMSLSALLRFMVVTIVTPSLLLPRLLCSLISLHGNYVSLASLSVGY